MLFKKYFNAFGSSAPGGIESSEFEIFFELLELVVALDVLPLLEPVEDRVRLVAFFVLLEVFLRGDSRSVSSDEDDPVENETESEEALSLSRSVDGEEVRV